MRFLNWRRTNGGVRVSVRIQRTPQQWLFQWETVGRRRYSKRELLDIGIVRFTQRKLPQLHLCQVPLLRLGLLNAAE